MGRQPTSAAVALRDGQRLETLEAERGRNPQLRLIPTTSGPRCPQAVNCGHEDPTAWDPYVDSVD